MLAYFVLYSTAFMRNEHLHRKQNTKIDVCYEHDEKPQLFTG